MRLPRFRIRTLMVVVGLAGVVSAVGAPLLREAARRTREERLFAWHRQQTAVCLQRSEMCSQRGDPGGAARWLDEAHQHLSCNLVVLRKRIRSNRHLFDGRLR